MLAHLRELSKANSCPDEQKDENKDENECGGVVGILEDLPDDMTVQDLAALKCKAHRMAKKQRGARASTK